MGTLTHGELVVALSVAQSTTFSWAQSVTFSLALVCSYRPVSCLCVCVCVLLSLVLCSDSAVSVSVTLMCMNGVLKLSVWSCMY